MPPIDGGFGTTQQDTSKASGSNHSGEAPWADFEITVPTDRDHASVVVLVECTLVELTHEAVDAVFVSRQVGRSTRTRYVAADDVGEQSQKRHLR